MIIRKATKADCEHVASCLMLAMEDIFYNFTGQRDYQVTRDLMRHFVMTENNQYSYQNCLVGELEGKVIAAVNCYDGADLIRLRQPVMDYIRANFNPSFNPENETQEGEIYIDSLGVDPRWQGKGIATRLLIHIIDQYVERDGKTLGLIVEAGNENAKALYLKLGFTYTGMKTLAGKEFEHLQISAKRKRISG
jgi:ribosomal protein S18 acetylase RimI-like enzyme